MRAFKANYEDETAGQNETALFYQPQLLDIPGPPPVDMPAPGLQIAKSPVTTPIPAVPENGKKNGKPVNSDLGYYFGQLKKISRDYLSTEEIKQTYEVVEKHERAILSIFYFMNSFSATLAGIGDKFKVKKETGKKGTPFTKEQLNLIAKISRKPLYKNADKKEEILRVRTILENISKRRQKVGENLIFQKIFKKFSGRYDSYVDFITSLAGMVRQIQSQEGAKAVENYLGVDYSVVRDAFNFIDEVVDLDFEAKYYYRKSFNALKKGVEAVKQAGKENPAYSQLKEKLEESAGLDYDLILKSIELTSLARKKITGLLNDFSEKFFRYVVFVAKKFIHGQLPFPDLIQEGNIGLLKAVKKFNHELGHQFITYAFWWIRQGITKAIADQSRTIRVPFHVHQEYGSMRKTMQSLKKELWKDPGVKHICAETGKSEKEVNHLLETFEFPLSLSQETKNGTGKPLSTFKADVKAEDPYILSEREALKDKIYYHLDSLGEREAELIKMRFGLKDGYEYTLEEVAQRFRLTRERVRQIEAKVLSVLKRNGEESLRPYLSRNREDIDYCMA